MRNKVNISFFFCSIRFDLEGMNLNLDENVSSTANNATSQGQNPPSGATGETPGKWVSMSARRAGAGTAYPNERGGSRPSGYQGRGNDMRKQGSHFFSIDKINCSLNCR